ncbi:hypothetical protein C6P40_000710 [Pichia californica]|uniref:Uncharacterized protein n=1 Tax=Pichia californica TaxID=460514 RepID=A0A9P6WKH3_9ASCO|nr:hypothetical protein C6P42_000757 [[Candida] californica]KAG0688647.1 hypothetical protein C6P40_000710 [[Candida] californica]
MLQASNTRLLHSNNFVSIGDNDRIYNTYPLGLDELIHSLSESSTIIDYLSIANYCKSLILNPAINSFNLKIKDILQIWETRILCLCLVYYSKKKSNTVINEKMLQFETNNILEQVKYLNNSNNFISTANSTNLNISNNNNKIKLNTEFNNLLMHLKYNGKDMQLLEYYYHEVFKSRSINGMNIEYLERLQFAILSVLFKRNDIITAYNMINMDETGISKIYQEKMKVIQQKIEDNERKGIEMYCLSVSLIKNKIVCDGGDGDDDDNTNSDNEDINNNLIRTLAQTLLRST